ncbi:MAG: uncharacterized protein PWQ99_202 [Clostridia bacterium]|jgi:hypothetical protein|uniref:DUF4912 domain-containing protein n=1 Tax=Thermacetogenium phaeum TaxID=85874 RepID=A0A101FFI7_9THEO|nr:MAG: Uncharacterized protein XD66_1190 [Thermacetogenium phaeum]MDK2880427.1 uncharacterized protein [Clostridia bacterium]MDN5365003.1 uncharacterized protein [Thermacetogenium sp.]MDN5375200.1 uncharacterized protein [Thermacetogenium sp.]
MSRKKIAAIKRSGVRKGSGARTNILHKVAMEAAEEVMPESHRPSSPEEKSVKKTVTLPEIPFSYGDTRIVAMARDPYWLFAYWEIGEAFKDEIRRRYGAEAWDTARLVLKVYDATNLYFYESRQAMEIAIDKHANNWYIHTGQPNRSYLVELGGILPDGTYFFIARSDIVTTPRDDVSEIVNLEWLLPTEYEKVLYGRFAGAGPGSPGFLKEMAHKEAARKREAYISSPLNW